ncbi:MAG: dihydrofolate reductase family protein [Ardenticatenaceae bacterium]|nr:dihydrofolate reductase family protein [Ardenticatenaceae bacterium]
MLNTVIQLYPLPAAERPLTNLYLHHNLRRLNQSSGLPFVYANFVVSLDGRIAIPHPAGHSLTVPKAIANDRDWRLFQELTAQADIIISSGRYLRDYADGRAQEILQTDDPRFADLRTWREEQGLAPLPDLAIISGSLNFPIPDILTAAGRRVVIFTTANPDPQRVRELETHAGQVIVAGDDITVDGAQMVQSLHDLGYRTIYSAAGPRVLHLLLQSGVLNRLYLTYANRLLGGFPFAAIVEGQTFPTAVGMTLHSLYHDPQALDGLGQLFAAYNHA